MNDELAAHDDFENIYTDNVTVPATNLMLFCSS